MHSVLDYKKGKLPFAALGVALAATALIVPLVGAGHVGWAGIKAGLASPDEIAAQIKAGLLQADDVTAGQIFWQLRVPRLLLGMLAGSTLAVAGVAFQSMFRNPLASPYTLGVSSGAGLGAALAMSLAQTWALLGTGWAVSAAAFLGAMGSVFIVYGLAGVRRGFSSNTLLLAGVSIGFVCSALILLIQYLSSQAVTNATVRWLMGTVDPLTGYAVFTYALPLVLAAMAVLAWHWREMDLLMMGGPGCGGARRERPADPKVDLFQRVGDGGRGGGAHGADRICGTGRAARGTDGGGADTRAAAGGGPCWAERSSCRSATWSPPMRCDG